MIRVFSDGLEINGKSILDLTTLAAECGTRLDLEARGPDAEAAVEALAELVLARFYEFRGWAGATTRSLMIGEDSQVWSFPASRLATDPCEPVSRSVKRPRRCKPSEGSPSALVSPSVRSGSSTPAAPAPRRAPIDADSIEAEFGRLDRALDPGPAEAEEAEADARKLGSARSTPTSSPRMPG